MSYINTVSKIILSFRSKCLILSLISNFYKKLSCKFVLSFFCFGNKVKIVSDNPGKDVMAIKENKKITNYNKIVFGTGESLKAITTTSNSHFVRAIKAQVIY